MTSNDTCPACGRSACRQCPYCGGSGERPETGYECDSCHGTGCAAPLAPSVEAVLKRAEADDTDPAGRSAVTPPSTS